MDNRKKEPSGRSRAKGWVQATPTPTHQPAMAEAVELPAPLPMPEMPVEAECGYCITIGMAYIPMQEFQEVYEAEEGFGRGTIFGELDLPFMGKGDCRRGQ